MSSTRLGDVAVNWVIVWVCSLSILAVIVRGIFVHVSLDAASVKLTDIRTTSSLTRAGATVEVKEAVLS